MPLTPLEKMLLDAGPLRDDGSDKFWGLENVSVQAVDVCAPFANHDPSPHSLAILGASSQSRQGDKVVLTISRQLL